MAENDSQIELKKRARRRLVGSAALALAAAIVLPMVMDHEPRPPSQDVQIRIPSQEGSNFTSRVISGKGPAPSQPVAGAVGESASMSVDDVVPAKGKLEAPALVEPPVALPAVKQEPAKPDPKKVEHKPEPKPEPKPRPPSEAERAKALLSGETPAPAKPTASHVVQLGVYREAGNVKALRAKLKAEGYNSYTEPVGDKLRVRAGPFPNKAAADKAAARIQKILGVSASVSPKP